MTKQNTSGNPPDSYCEGLKRTLAGVPCVAGAVASARAPAVVDVMGGICEDSGSLVITATVGLSFVVSIWRVAGKDLTVRLLTEAGRGPGHDVALPIAQVIGASGDGKGIIDVCHAKGGDWAAPVFLTIHKAVSQGLAIEPPSGLMILVQTDFPPDVDLGRHTVVAAATLEALCRLNTRQVDRAIKSQVCSEAVERVTGMRSVRTAMTALAGPADGSLLQIQFHPQPACESLALPPGVTILAARTILGRPVTRERLIDTRICTQMGQYFITRAEAPAGGLKVDRLSAITPTEFVEYYRDVLPSKISAKQIKSKYGEIPGLNGDLDPTEVYKVRSRAEHHVYEHRRVHEFAAALSRARRTGAMDDLREGGSLMYASHWSHSQRCGIGGVETDRIASSVRALGPDSGVYGAKVTGGGAGGEMVVLLRDDAATSAIFGKAIAEAQALSNRSIHILRGTMAGAELYQPQFPGVV